MNRNRKLVIWAAAAVALVLPSSGSPGVALPTVELPGHDSVVGRFTTRFPCCQPRVGNIALAARTVDGTVVPPEGFFSLNDALGERTEAKGYRPAPTVGGGVGQLATTLYNAVFRGGLQLIAHTSQPVFARRYPAGRDATVSWGGPDLVFRNDWPAPLTIRTRATGTSVTVRLLSRPLGRDVRTWSGRRRAVVRPSTVRIVNPALVPGAARVVQQAGAPGFTIVSGRSVYEHGILRGRQRVHVRYARVNRIVEVGPRQGSLLALLPAQARALVSLLERVVLAALKANP